MASLSSKVTCLCPSLSSHNPSSLSTPGFCSLPRSFSPLRLHIVAMANPSTTNPVNIGDKLSESIKAAEEVCAAETGSGECAAAWDEVEELSAEIAHKRVQNSKDNDPLEKFCKEEPQSDECRVYED